MRRLTDDQILMMAYYIVCPSNDFMRSRGVNVADGTRVGWYCKFLLKDVHVGTMSNAYSDQRIEWYAEHRDPKKAIKAVDVKALKDAADIALFGRMVANDHSLTVEAATMFSHALSTRSTWGEFTYQYLRE